MIDECCACPSAICDPGCDCQCTPRYERTGECGNCALESQHLPGPCWWPNMSLLIACCAEFCRTGLDHGEPCSYLGEDY